MQDFALSLSYDIREKHIEERAGFALGSLSRIALHPQAPFCHSTKQGPSNSALLRWAMRLGRLGTVNENSAHSLRHLSTRFLVSGAVWKHGAAR